MHRSENNYLSSVGNESLRFDDHHTQCGIDKARDLRAQFWSDWLRNAIDYLTGWIGNGIAAMRRAHKYRRAVRELSSMPNWLLQDIGIHRSEIRSLVYDDSERRSSMPQLPARDQRAVAKKQPDQLLNSIHFDNAA